MSPDRLWPSTGEWNGRCSRAEVSPTVRSRAAVGKKYMSELGKLMHRLMGIARKGDPALCAEPMSGVTRQVEGLRSEGRFGALSITIDEPTGFGGTGTAPNPAEVALAALGA